MKDYQTRLKRHLADYGRRQLRLSEGGVWRGRQYDHIIPLDQWNLNFLPGCRADLLAYLAHADNLVIKRHQCFHHLSSSQAFAFNLFFPFLNAGLPDAHSLTSHFGSRIADQWKFEAIPDPAEGTNVDVSWSDARGGTLYCEVKLSEGGFSTAVDDNRHRRKLDDVYRPALKPLVDAKLLEPKRFFANYQILRNVALLRPDPRHELAFLVPKENGRLTRQLERVFERVPAATLARIRVVYIEELLDALLADKSISASLLAHVAAVAAKYLPLVE